MTIYSCLCDNDSSVKWKILLPEFQYIWQETFNGNAKYKEEVERPIFAKLTETKNFLCSSEIDRNNSTDIWRHENNTELNSQDCHISNIVQSSVVQN